MDGRGRSCSAIGPQHQYVLVGIAQFQYEFPILHSLSEVPIVLLQLQVLPYKCYPKV